MEPETIAAPDPASPGHRRGFRGAAAFWGRLLLLLAVLAGMASPFWGPHALHLAGLPGPTVAMDSPDSDPGALLEALEQRLARLEGTTEAQAQQIAAVPPMLDALEQGQTRLDGQIEDLRRAAGEQADPLGVELDEIQRLVKQFQETALRFRERIGLRIDAIAAGQLEEVTRIGQIQDRQQHLEEQWTPRMDTVGRDLAALSVRLDRLAGIGQRLEESVQQLQGRLGQVETNDQRAARVDLDRTALIVSVGQLRAAAATGSPFVESLARTEQLIARRGAETLPADIARAREDLRLVAEVGAPAHRFLQAGLEQGIDALAQGSDDRQGWWRRVFGRLMEPVVIRPKGFREGKDVLSTAVRAEAFLRSGDLEIAVREIESIRTQTPVFESWLGDARLRLQLEQALGLLDRWIGAELAELEKS